MKIISLVLIALFLYSCGAAVPMPNRSASFDLSQEFEHAEQHYAGPKRIQPFRLRAVRRKGKHLPAIEQTRVGSISFYRKLEPKSVLRFLLQVGATPEKSIVAHVDVESDYPTALKRTYPVKPEQSHAIDLAPFENRVVKITLSARRKTDVRRLSLQWIQPVIEQTNVQSADSDAAISRLRSRHGKHNILIVLMDAANPFHFGCYGYDKPTTPNIDRFARDSVLWEKAFAAAAYTLASTGSLFTGLHPDIHQVVAKSDKLHDRFVTLAEMFRNAGFKTAQFLANGFAGPAFGYSQGFDRVWTPDQLPDADDFVPVVQQWLQEVRGQRFFGYIHFREPHFPFRASPELFALFDASLDFRLPIFDHRLRHSEEEKRRIVAAYDANLAFVDQQFGRLLEYMKTSGLLEETIVILLSDHGEAFWEHGFQGHNTVLYEETMRIPLLVRFPGDARLKGIRKADLVSNVDMLPTLVDLAGISRRNLFTTGKSLLPLLVSGNQPEDRVILMRGTGQRPSYALRTNDFKFIHSIDRRRPEELYLLANQHLETENVIAQYPITSRYYSLALVKKVTKLREMSPIKPEEAQKATPDEATEEQLRALGYTN